MKQLYLPIMISGIVLMATAILPRGPLQAQPADGQYQYIVVIGEHGQKEVVRVAATHQLEKLLRQQQQQKQAGRQQKGLYIPPGSEVRNYRIILAEPPEDGNYQTFEVIDMNAYERGELMAKLASHQAKGDLFYEQLETTDTLARQKVAMSMPGEISPPQPTDMETFTQVATLIGEVDAAGEAAITETGEIAMAEENVAIEHIYRITEEGEYEYYDGRPIVGGRKYRVEFKDGYKPITEITFYYQVGEKTSLDEVISLREFLLLPPDEQRQLIDNLRQTSSIDYGRDEQESLFLDNLREDVRYEDKHKGVD